MLPISTEMRYCEISKEMSPLYFGLAVFCLLEARASEYDMQSLPSPLYSVHTNSVTITSNWQKTPSPKYNDDIYLLTYEYLISEFQAWTFMYGYYSISQHSKHLLLNVSTNKNTFHCFVTGAFHFRVFQRKQSL
jgi:hypothetical protein